jgi:hypothetical protein
MLQHCLGKLSHEEVLANETRTSKPDAMTPDVPMMGMAN